jgi:hypothetical protein
MARRQDGHYERPVPSEIISPFSQRPSDNLPDVEGDETTFDVDEPPEHQKLFHPSFVSNEQPSPNVGYYKLPALPANAMGRRESLLTQALMTSPTQQNFPVGRALSNASIYSNTSNATSAELTSDGGLTSPARTNTPSPPLPPTNAIRLPHFSSNSLDKVETLRAHHQRTRPTAAVTPAIVTAEKKPEELLGRKRCITFACGAPAVSQVAKVPIEPMKTEEPIAAKRPCALRFACTTRPDKDNHTDLDSSRKTARPSPPLHKVSHTRPGAISLLHQDSQTSQSTIKETTAKKSSTPPRPTNISVSPKAKSKSSKYRVEDEAWMNETPRARPKITVSDTLRKENIIRKIGEEAEEEALEEEDAEYEAELEGNTGDSDEGEENSDSDDEASDGGNESDDEHGFAESDDDDEADSVYQFWAPGARSATDSGSHIDHIRPTARRTASESSIESTLKTSPVNIDMTSPSRNTRYNRRKKAEKIRSATPELPDSTDFVCGTLDEDRPLEVAYIQYLEQQQLAKRGKRPQDVDPSFPTSDPEEGDEDDDDDVDAGSDEENPWVAGRPDDSDEGLRRGRADGTSRLPKKSPAPSPRRLRSPPPKRQGGHKSPPPNKHAHTNRSPPPKHLFGHSPRRVRSPAPRARDIKSPPSSPRRTSVVGSGGHQPTPIDMPLLAQRPNLTHTKSLPRTPNPYFSRRNIEALAAARSDRVADAQDAFNEQFTRGPIDIVQGLERKRQRRKEKYLRLHCRHGAKEKDRRVQPGKGAQRMRELGMEMADRNRAYGPRAEVILSI